MRHRRIQKQVLFIYLCIFYLNFFSGRARFNSYFSAQLSPEDDESTLIEMSSMKATVIFRTTPTH